jgi:hypothetical protein
MTTFQSPRPSPSPQTLLRPSILEAVAVIPMEIWKRLAVYPGLAWFLLLMFLPCRLTPRTTAALWALSAIGVAGAWIHLEYSRRDDGGSYDE